MANKKITDLMSGTPVRDSLLESAIDISGTMDSRKVKAGLVADLASANVASPYDETVTYAIGQYCLYEGDIYRCIAITTGAFDATAWTQIVVTGEYRRVVELLSAEYEALTPAEQNNGTIYIKTDEETTAADIPYSSGVSVADKLDDLTTPVISSVTWNANNVTGDTVRNQYIQVGKLVVLALEFTPLSGKIGNGYIIATGLPIPNSSMGSATARFVLMAGANKQLGIDSTGQLIWYFPGNTSDLSRIEINAVYIAE